MTQTQLTLFKETKSAPAAFMQSKTPSAATEQSKTDTRSATTTIYRCKKCGARFYEPKQTKTYTAICPGCGAKSENIEAI